MIWNQKIQLVELIRILQNQSHIFTTDPQGIDEVLRHEDAPIKNKLIRRAQWIDSDKALQRQLHSIHQYRHWLLWLVCAFLILSGFLGTWALMRSPQINFFYVLLSVLGMHSIMLLLWCVMTLRSGSLSPAWFYPLRWLRIDHSIKKAVVQLFSEQANHAAMRWYVGEISHRFWLCTLSGMWLAVLLLLLVRQYYFVWESTLLSADALAVVVSCLSWLPEKLGLSMPNRAMVVAGRGVAEANSARAWGYLLLFSIVAYGMFPRFLAWLFCRLARRKNADYLPLNLPYYQHIIQFWQKSIVDADDVDHMQNPTSAPIKINQAQKWACVLDMAWHQPTWFHHFLGQQWHDCGVLATREDDAQLRAKMNQESVQLLVGVRAHTLPDRGTVRRLQQLRDSAKGGVIIQLLAETTADSGSLNTRLNQWHQALTAAQMAWFDPPHIAQQNRLEREI